MSTPCPGPVPETPRPLSLAIGGLAALAAAVGIGRFVYTPILPLMVEDLGMTKGVAGLLASANFAGYLAGALLAATPAVSGSRRRWLLSALIASSLTTGAMAFASSTVAFLTLRFIGGVASAFVLVFASALVLDRLGSAGRPDLAAVHFAGVGTGIALSAALVSSLAAWGGGWRSRWLASGLSSVLAVGIVAGLIPDRLEAPIAMTPRPHRVKPRLAALVVAYGLFGSGYIITATFLVAIVRGSAQVHAFEPLVWLVVGLTAAPSVALWTSVGEKIGIARAFVACVVEAGGVGASVLWLTPPVVLLAAALLGGTFMGIIALGLVRARRLSQGDPRRTLAVMTAAFGLGQIVGPLFASVVYDATGTFLVPSLTAVSTLLVGALLAMVGTTRTRSRMV
jgi:predicted MFS family arabinose efflux permease